MASSIKEYLVSLGFNIDQQGINNFSSALKKASIATAGLGAAVTVAGGLVTEFIASTAESFDTLAHVGERVHSTVEEIKRGGFIASVTGSSMDAYTASLEGLNRTAGEAALGIGRGALAFKKLGLSTRDQNGNLKTSAQLLDDVGQKIKGLQATEQIAILEKLGIDPSLVNMLTGDVSKLKDEFNSIYQGIGVNANEAGKSSVEFIDSMTRLKFVFKTLKDAVALKFMPQIMQGMEGFRKFLLDNAPKIIATLTPIFDIIIKISGSFFILAGRAAQMISKVIDWFSKFNSTTHGAAALILSLVAAWKFLNLSFLATPLGILITLAASIALLIDDYMTFQEGGKSLINWNGLLGRTLSALAVTLGAVAAAVVVVKGAMTAWAVTQAVINTALGAARIAMLGFNLVMYANPIGLVIASIAALIGAGFLLIKNWDKVKSWFSSFFDWFSEKFGKVAEVAGKVVGAVKGVFGKGEDGGGSSSLKPSASTVANLQNKTMRVNQDTKIIIDGSKSPEATAKAVSSEQSRVNADMARNLSGATQ